MSRPAPVWWPVVRLALAGLLAALVAPARAAEDPLVRDLGPGEVDWGKGVVRVRAGAAPDMRMPGPDAARADAHRRARTRAQALLREALGTLPLGPGRKLSKATLEAAAGRARQASVDFQSNGGVLLALELPFVEIDAPAPAAPAAPAGTADALTIAVPSMPFEAMPTLLLRKQEVATTAVYRLGDPPKGTTAVRARRDRAGRLLLPAATASPPARTPVVIYVRSAARR